MDLAAEGGKRVGFFGGSFDPPHLGHLAVARAAQKALSLDTVLFAPVGAQPLKPNGSTAPFEDRVAMTELAIAGENGFAVTLADAPRSAGGANYTLETLGRLRKEMTPDQELFLVLGADAFTGLGEWRGGAEIPFAASLIVASRPGQRLDDLAAHLPEGVELERGSCEGSKIEGSVVQTFCLRNKAGDSAQIHILPGLQVDISATAIRNQVRATAAEGIADVLPPAVVDYIRSHGLYQ